VAELAAQVAEQLACYDYAPRPAASGQTHSHKTHETAFFKAIEAAGIAERPEREVTAVFEAQCVHPGPNGNRAFRARCDAILVKDTGDRRYVVVLEIDEWYHQGYPAEAETERIWRMGKAAVVKLRDRPHAVTALRQYCCVRYNPHPEEGTDAFSPAAAAALARTLLASATMTGVLYLNYPSWRMEQLAATEFGSRMPHFQVTFPQGFSGQPSFTRIPVGCRQGRPGPGAFACCWATLSVLACMGRLCSCCRLPSYCLPAYSTAYSSARSGTHFLQSRASHEGIDPDLGATSVDGEPAPERLGLVRLLMRGRQQVQGRGLASAWQLPSEARWFQHVPCPRM
jgi:hypothetical protein